MSSFSWVLHSKPGHRSLHTLCTNGPQALRDPNSGTRRVKMPKLMVMVEIALLWSFNTPQQSGNEAKTSSSRPKETPPRDPAYKDAVKAASSNWPVCVHAAALWASSRTQIRMALCQRWWSGPGQVCQSRDPKTHRGFDNKMCIYSVKSRTIST